MWGLDEPVKDSQGFHSVNPTYLATARPGGIFFEISPFKNRYDLLENVNDYSLWFMPTILNDTNKLTRLVSYGNQAGLQKGTVKSLRTVQET